MAEAEAVAFVLDLVEGGCDRSHDFVSCRGRGRDRGRRGYEAKSFLVVVFFHQNLLTSCLCPSCPMTTQQHQELQAGRLRPAVVEGYFFLNIEFFYHNAILTPF